MKEASGRVSMERGKRKGGASRLSAFALRKHVLSRCESRQSFLRRSFVVAILVFGAGGRAEVFAQTKPIDIEQSGMQPAIQMGRPILTWWDVKIKGTGLMEGRLEFQMYHDQRLLATTTTEDLALTGPQQRIRVMLPPVDDPMIPVDQLRVEIQFRGNKLNQHLGSQMLRVAMVRLRTFMALTSVSRLASKRTTERERVIHRLSFESLAPADLDENVKTVHNVLEPPDLPQEPIAYCAYEMVILFASEFQQLRKPQLDALLAWVRAGGSLYVEPTEVLEPWHTEFLRALTAADSRNLIIQPDSHGRLNPGTIWEDERMFLVSSGLGRSVIRVDEEEQDRSVETAEWRQASAFLWRLHADQIRIAAKTPSNRLLPFMPHGWHPSFDGNGGIYDNPGRDQSSPQIYPPQTQLTASGMPVAWLNCRLRTSTSELLDRLMPDGVQMVPLWVLALILTFFVIWIGPVDYYVLGMLRARKFTWITFPLATVLVTAFTVWITNRYMSSAETRRSLIVRDIGDDGQVVRTNRFELLFIASTRPTTTDVRKGVFTPLDTNTFNEYGMVYPAAVYQSPQFYGSRRSVYVMPSGDQIDRTPSRLQGRIPTEFTVTQQMSKWTPQLNRVFAIPGSKEDNVVDWNKLAAELRAQPNFASHAVSNQLIAFVHDQFGPNAMVGCLAANGRWAFDHHAGWSSNPQFNSDYPFAQFAPPFGNHIGNGFLPNEILQQPALFRWMYQHSLAIPYGVFGLISSTGPTGGPNLSDLPILDASDPNLVLLIVVVPRDGDFVAYRKLIRLAESGTTSP